MSKAKLTKALKLARLPFWRRIMLRYRVGAAIEHCDAITYCAPHTLIDVGANKGQFSAAVRGILPFARIYSFEPLKEPAGIFKAIFEHDTRTSLFETALGAHKSEMTFYVTSRNDSSSLLRPNEDQLRISHLDTARETSVPVAPLSDFLDLNALAGPVMLKIDVQGFELEVLRGISDLDKIDFIYVELSFVELYENQALFSEVCKFLMDKGFRVRGVFNQWFDRRLGPVQADCLFERLEHDDRDMGDQSS